MHCFNSQVRAPLKTAGGKLLASDSLFNITGEETLFAESTHWLWRDCYASWFSPEADWVLKNQLQLDWENVTLAGFGENAVQVDGDMIELSFSNVRALGDADPFQAYTAGLSEEQYRWRYVPIDPREPKFTWSVKQRVHLFNSNEGLFLQKLSTEMENASLTIHYEGEWKHGHPGNAILSLDESAVAVADQYRRVTKHGLTLNYDKIPVAGVRPGLRGCFLCQ